MSNRPLLSRNTIDAILDGSLVQAFRLPEATPTIRLALLPRKKKARPGPFHTVMVHLQAEMCTVIQLPWAGPLSPLKLLRQRPPLAPHSPQVLRTAWLVWLLILSILVRL